jgi:hypothetical protein
MISAAGHGYWVSRLWVQVKFVIPYEKSRFHGVPPHFFSQEYLRTPPFVESYPELETPYCFHLPVVRAVEIRLRGANVRMAHQSLNGSEVIPVIQEGSGEGVPHHMGVNPLL